MTETANIVSGRQLQRLNQIKSMMQDLRPCPFTLRTQLEDMRNYYHDIIECKNSDNSKEFIKDMKARLDAITLLLNV